MKKRRKRRARAKKVTPPGSFNAYAFGNALGIIFALSILLYGLITWFGMYVPTIIENKYPIPFKFTNWTIVVGILETYVLGYIGGWIFAKTYNKSKRR